MKSLWLDGLHRGLIDSGEIQRMASEQGLHGVIFNWKSFERSVSAGTEYDSSLVRMLKREDLDAGELFEALTIQDARAVAETFQSLYERSHGVLGYVSLAISPRAFGDGRKMLELATSTWNRVARPNVLIQVPATIEGISILPALVERKIGFHLTWVFSVETYRKATEAYLSALERAPATEKLGLGSIASFRLKVLDLFVDTLLGDRIRSSTDEEEIEKLKSKLGRAGHFESALALAYYEDFYKSERWKKLAARGALPQRILWDALERESNLQEAIDYWKGLENLGLSSGALGENLLRNEIAHANDAYDRVLEALERKRREKMESKLNPTTYSLPGGLTWLVDERMRQWEIPSAGDWTLESGKVLEYLELGKRIGRESEHVVFLGRGDVTVVARAMRDLFPTERPRVDLLDSIDPEEIQQASYEQAHFIISSHGPETKMLQEFFKNRFPGAQFTEVIGESGGSSFLQSCFVAALIGIDTEAYLDRAMRMAHSCAPWLPAVENPAVHLGILLHVLSQHGRDKLTVVASPRFSGFVEWLDLVFSRHPVLPLIAENPRSFDSYGADRVFLFLKEDRNEAQEHLLIRVQEAGHPVIRVQIQDPLNIGQEILRFETASRTFARMEELNLSLSKGDRALSFDGRLDLVFPLQELFSRLHAGDYFAVLSYLPRVPEVEDLVNALRDLVQREKRVASVLSHRVETCLRDSLRGVVLQLTHDESMDLAIPGRWTSFGRFKDDRVANDTERLRGRGRAVLALKIQGRIPPALESLYSQIESALSGAHQFSRRRIR